MNPSSENSGTGAGNFFSIFWIFRFSGFLDSTDFWIQSRYVFKISKDIELDLI